MALPLNIYKSTFSTSLGAVSFSEVYTAPTGYSAVLLALTACNTTNAVQTVSVRMNRPAAGAVSLVHSFEVPVGDTADLASGKIVVEPGDTLEALASDPGLHLTVSVLETKL